MGRRRSEPLALALAWMACAPAPRAAGPDPSEHPARHAVEWMAHAQEYRAVARVVYAAAIRALDAALANDGTATSAALEQTDATVYAALPPAVILDVDETVLDNTPYNAALVARGERDFDAGAFRRWALEARAEAVPGALAFARHATERGVAVFYVTNRPHALEEATWSNLDRLGFPLRSDLDVVLTRDEIDTDGADKSNRRRVIAATHRVLLLVGDDLGDFVPRSWTGPGDRDAQLEQHRARWGTQWFVLPNPVYGSWRSTLP